MADNTGTTTSSTGGPKGPKPGLSPLTSVAQATNQSMKERKITKEDLKVNDSNPEGATTVVNPETGSSTGD